MRRLLLAATLVLAPLSARAAADPCHTSEGAPIDRLEVYGVQSSPAGLIETTTRLRPGMIVSPLSLTKLEDSILATGWFAHASVVLLSEDGGCSLRVRVEEFPAVSSVRFTGITRYDSATLAALLASKPGTPANKNVVAKDAETLVAKYHDDGFEAARVVSFDVEGGVITFRILEGHITRVEVVGARRTGSPRVRELLGVKPGSVYDAAALIDGQSTLYRTGLFSSVGFGVETPHGAQSDDDSLVLTVTVGEILSPYSRTEVDADRSQSRILVDASMRNLAAGHSASTALVVYSPSPARLAEVGFDDFYALHGRVDLHLFRPTPAAAGAFFGLDLERVYGRAHPELGARFEITRPAARAGLEIPAIASPSWEGTGSFSGAAGVASINSHSFFDPNSSLEKSDRGFARGELGFSLHRIAGLDTPARARIHSGVEWNGGEKPFAWLDASTDARLTLVRGLRVEGAADGAALTGDDVPVWREIALEGADGPTGAEGEYAFCRRYARARTDLVYNGVRGLAGVAAGGGAVIFSGAGGNDRAKSRKSVHAELRAGPSFARIAAGVAAPLPGARASDLFWYASLVVGTPE